jgi:hypothetical protein
MTKTPAYFVAFHGRWSYVRGLDAAVERLASYLGITAEEVRARRGQIAGLIQCVSEKKARMVGL